MTQTRHDAKKFLPVNNLALGQIYSALAYYWDHQEELDQYIQRRLDFVDDVREQIGHSSPLVKKLRAKGLL